MEGLRQAGLRFGARGSDGSMGPSMLEVVKHGSSWSKEGKEVEVGGGLRETCSLGRVQELARRWTGVSRAGR